jgi:hypothetical protein
MEDLIKEVVDLYENDVVYVGIDKVEDGKMYVLESVGGGEDDVFFRIGKEIT